jgi:glycosyltransferase involved in cell wall biosynthesis
LEGLAASATDEVVVYAPECGEITDRQGFLSWSEIESRFANGRLRRSILRSRSAFRRLGFEMPRLLSRDAIDIAQFQYIGPIRSPCPIAIAIHDVSFCLAPAILGWKTSSRLRLTTRSAVRRAKIVLTPSEWSTEMVVHFYPEAASKIRTIPLGVSPQFSARATTADEDIRARVRLPESYFLYVGRRQRRKNVNGLLTSYQKALTIEPDLPPLVLVGPSGEGNQALAWARGNDGLGGHTRTIDDLPDSCLPAIFRGARGLLFPCRYEGFGLPVLEAMACGCPVVVSDEGGLPALVQEAGIKVDPTDSSAWAHAIVALNGDTRRRAEMAEAGRERARRYSWRATAEGTRAAYEAALGN